MDGHLARVYLDALDEEVPASELDQVLRDADDGTFGDFVLRLNELTTPCRIAVDAELGIPLLDQDNAR